jgi:hypothetical protein
VRVEGPFTQQQHAQDLAAGAQRHGQADAGGGERTNLVEPVRTVRRGPFGEGGQVVRRKRHRQRIGSQPIDQKSVTGNHGHGRFERARDDQAAVVTLRAGTPLEQRGRFDAQFGAHAGERGAQCAGVRVSAARGVDEGRQHVRR